MRPPVPTGGARYRSTSCVPTSSSAVATTARGGWRPQRPPEERRTAREGYASACDRQYRQETGGARGSADGRPQGGMDPAMRQSTRPTHHSWHLSHSATTLYFVSALLLLLRSGHDGTRRLAIPTPELSFGGSCRSSSISRYCWIWRDCEIH